LASRKSTPQVATSGTSSPWPMVGKSAATTGTAPPGAASHSPLENPPSPAPLFPDLSLPRDPAPASHGQATRALDLTAPACVVPCPVRPDLPPAILVRGRYVDDDVDDAGDDHFEVRHLKLALETAAAAANRIDVCVLVGTELIFGLGNWRCAHRASLRPGPLPPYLVPCLIGVGGLRRERRAGAGHSAARGQRC
jgi:hypothetical protein